MEVKYIILTFLFLSFETGCSGIKSGSVLAIESVSDALSPTSSVSYSSKSSTKSSTTSSSATTQTFITSESVDTQSGSVLAIESVSDAVSPTSSVSYSSKSSTKSSTTSSSATTQTLNFITSESVDTQSGSVLAIESVSDAVSPTSSVSYSSKSSTKSSTTSSSATTQAFITSESVDTPVVVGIVVDLGLFFLISCMLLYIARRRSLRDVSERPEPPTFQPQPSRYAVGRTLTNFYDKMKTNRPLPRIPASIRNMTRLKRQHNAESGVYDSIKSNNNNGKYQLNKQVSQGSDCSYLEPATITSICEGVASKDVNDFCPKLESYPKNTQQENVHTLKVHQVSAKRSSAVKDAENFELNKATYINLISKKDSLHDSGYHGDKEDTHGDYENTPMIHTYINTADAQKISKIAHDPDPVAESHDPTYMDMC